jgi:hypothetical protein
MGISSQNSGSGGGGTYSFSNTITLSGTDGAVLCRKNVAIQEPKYDWDLSGWQECEGSNRIRIVTCKDPNGSPLPDNRCNGARPTNTSTCTGN